MSRWELGTLGLIVVLALGIVMLSGCAEMKGPIQGTCAMLPLGQNESGVQFFRYQCQPAE